LGFVVGWTEADSDALFRQPSDEPVEDESSALFDGSLKAMQRLRFPFDANPADVAEQQQEVPLDDDDRR
jgi:hypothetical protein